MHVWKFAANKSTNSTQAAGNQNKHISMTGTSQGVSKETSTLSVVVAPSKITHIEDVVNSDKGLINAVYSGHEYNVDLVEKKHPGTDWPPFVVELSPMSDKVQGRPNVSRLYQLESFDIPVDSERYSRISV